MPYDETAQAEAEPATEVEPETTVLAPARRRGNLTIEEQTRAIKAELTALHDADDAAEAARLRIGQMLKDLKAQVKWGEWGAYCATHFNKRSMRDIRRLVSMAEAPDPNAAHEAEKQKQRDARAAAATKQDRGAARRMKEPAADDPEPEPTPLPKPAQTTATVPGEINVAAMAAAMPPLPPATHEPEVKAALWLDRFKQVWSEGSDADHAAALEYIHPLADEPEVVEPGLPEPDAKSDIAMSELETTDAPAEIDISAIQAVWKDLSAVSQNRCRGYVCDRWPTGYMPLIPELKFAQVFEHASAAQQDAFTVYIGAAVS